MSKGIYVITNKINNKVYIGQSINIERRWLNHKSNAFNQNSELYDYPLYRAFRKYRLENFDFKIVEEVEDKEDLINREIYYYDLLKDEYGTYNQCRPMKNYGGTNSKPVYQISTDNYEILGVYPSAEEAQRTIGLTGGHIYEVCLGNRNSSGGYFWCYVEEYGNWTPPTKFGMNWRKTAIVQVNKDTGELIDVWESAAEASRELDIDSSSIRKVCRGVNKTAGGFKWINLNDYEKGGDVGHGE